METLYDLLGALPGDDADALRAAFRRAVKGAHPDLCPGDPDAGLKFREIVRANEILGDTEQRAVYDHLLDLAEREQERAAEHARVGRVHALASGVMALAGALAMALGAYALFVHLSTSAALPPTNPDAPAPKAELADSVIEQPQSAPVAAPDDASTRVGPPLDITSHEARAYWALGVDATRSGDLNTALADFDQAIAIDPKFASAYIERGVVLYHLHQFDRAFADISRGRRLTKAGLPASARKKLGAATNSTAKPPVRRTAEVPWQTVFPFLRRP